MSIRDVDLTCASCGRRIARRGSSGLYAHRSGGAVAACDLDSDHAAAPDWRPLGEVTCGVCGRPARAGSGNVLTHADAELDADHAPDPWAG